MTGEPMDNPVDQEYLHIQTYFRRAWRWLYANFFSIHFLSIYFVLGPQCPKIIKIIYSRSKGPKLINGREGRESFRTDKYKTVNRAMRYALLSLETKLGPMENRGKERGFDLLSERAF